jgi:hypothetical protein
MAFRVPWLFGTVLMTGPIAPTVGPLGHTPTSRPGLMTGARRESTVHNHSSYSIFSCAATGGFLVEFLLRTQRLLRPLDLGISRPSLTRDRGPVLLLP